MNVYAPGHRIHHVPRDKLNYFIKSEPILNQIIKIHKSRYYISEFRGKGSFGEVYAARRIPDGKQFAVKRISLAIKSAAVADELRKSFQKEVELSRRLATTSKHIIYMYDFDFLDNGSALILMELGQGSLEGTLAHRPPLSSVERKAIWRQCVDIAITLHNHEIVHLDIKPDNLVVFPGNFIKLVDLGIAQIVHQKRIGPTGTEWYTAPEVRLLPGNYEAFTTRKSDIWSWGAVLYRMTYGRPPFYSNTDTSYYPPANKPLARDPNLLSVLRHTLLNDPSARADAPWLAYHPYTRTP